MTLNFYNKTGNKDLYLFFDYDDGDNSGSKEVTGFTDLTYKQPWADGTLALDKPFTCSFTYINSGTFWYIITNSTGAKTIAANPGVAMGTADKNWVGGFFELTYLKDQDTFFDVTNVDQMGLLCGCEFKDSTGASKGHAGYGKTADDMIAGLISACDLSATTSAKISISTDSGTYTKLWGPTVPEVSSEYNKTYDDYIDAIKSNGTVMNILSDSTIKSPHGGTQLNGFNFSGQFGEPTFDLPAGCPISKSEIIAWFKGKESDPNPSDTDETYIFLTKEGLNGGTIMSGNSAGGMYVYPAFEYADPSDQSTIKKGGWASNVSLNWTATGSQAVALTTCFQATISSVIRDLITAMNLGYIGVTEAKKDFTYKDLATYATSENQEKYLNNWNNYITENSDSYGMAYSDGTHAKVQFHPPADGSIDCYIFGQANKQTEDYWSKVELA